MTKKSAGAICSACGGKRLCARPIPITRYRVYPNLERGLVLSNINQLWVSDITYIRLRREFVYLAVILDAYSRRCIGWALSRHIDTQLTIKALRMALANRSLPPGLVHHPDRGVQYAAADYVALLQEHRSRSA